MHGPREEGRAKPIRGKAGQEGGRAKSMSRQNSIVSAEEAKQDAKGHTPLSVGREAEAWTERVLSAPATASQAASCPFAKVGLVALHTA